MKKATNQGRTPAKTLKTEDLAKATGGNLLLGCCTQGCCSLD